MLVEDLGEGAAQGDGQPAVRRQRIGVDALQRRAGIADQDHAQRIVRRAGAAGHQQVGLGMIRDAGDAVGDRPRRAHGAGGERGVSFVPVAARPPHRPLGDDRHRVGRGDRDRDRGRGQRRIHLLDGEGQALQRRNRRSRAAPAARRTAAGTPRGSAPAPATGWRSAGTCRRTCRSRPRPGTSRVPSAVTPVPSMPAVHNSLPRLMYIARSTMIGVPLLLWNSPATSAASSPGMASALIVRRWWAPTA